MKKIRNLLLSLCIACSFMTAMPLKAEENVPTVSDETTETTEETAQETETSQEETESTQNEQTEEKETSTETEEASQEETTNEDETESDVEDDKSEDEIQTLSLSVEDELIAVAKTGGSYTLTENVTLSQQLDILGDLKLDLGGYELKTEQSWMFVINDGASLTISNGTVASSNQNGASNATALFYVFAGGNLTIDSGSYSNFGGYNAANKYVSKAIITNFGNLTINDGTFGSERVLNNYNYAVINDGTFTGNTSINTYLFGLFENSETYIVKGSISDAVYGIGILNNTVASVPVSSSLSHYSNYTEYNYLLTDDEYANPVKLVWGNIDESGPVMTTRVGIYGNFWNSETDITINSGTIISQGTAIYHPQQGTFTDRKSVV